METLKVSSTSDPSSTAGALANSIRENGKVKLQVIGPRAVNQAIKAIAIARGYIAPSGVDLVSSPQFVDITIDGEERTAIRMLVEPRNPISSIKPHSLTKEEDQGETEVVKEDRDDKETQIDEINPQEYRPEKEEEVG